MADKTPTMNELRTLPNADLQVQLDALRRQRWLERQKVAEGALQQTHRLGAARRQIARLLTVLKARHRGATDAPPVAK